MLPVSSYRTMAAVLVAALPCLAVDCGRTCDDCLPCQPQRIGSSRLRPASLGWLPDPAPDSVRFVNSNGFRAALRRAPLPTPDSAGQQAAVDASNFYYLLNENISGGCGPYFSTERRRLRYEGRNLPLTISYALLRDFRGTYPPPSAALPDGAPLTQAVADTLPDVLLIGFNGQPIVDIPVVRRPYRSEFQGTRYLDSVQLVGRVFRGVYRRTVALPGSTALQLRALYFQPGQGVVGFTYTNGEEWARF
ncbi:hypothetical protein LJ737_01420 [Hymenobacter sp. 15J16-1T3B]|uniref:hypothetical protein n=1 Tax=Hymenobacter sp. 15J16-1T3B TaxID=2886941 RepID=UPI001D127DCF|nr:hypothetical protein [Hymenobacter sp. 15J16-1T3B]MCC3155877.1 hypothetical protein [Hymenobacter sp. 15J16-1T3B]